LAQVATAVNPRGARGQQLPKMHMLGQTVAMETMHLMHLIQAMGTIPYMGIICTVETMRLGMAIQPRARSRLCTKRLSRMTRVLA
jgi:hypothetical protein